MIDIIKFLEDNNVPYITTGPNVAKGNVNVSCPWCGPADPSMHLGIELSKGWFGCWRDSDHRGKNVARLVQALIGCSWSQAITIAGQSPNRLSGFDAWAQTAFRAPTKQSRLDCCAGIVLPKEFKALSPTIQSSIQNPYLQYLASRGFGPEDLDEVCTYYNLYYCPSGKWRGRIIIPIYYKGMLVSWTGRSIFKSEKIRYKTLSANPNTANDNGDPCSGITANHLLLDYDFLMQNGSKTNKTRLFICEGPFDAIKLDTLGHRYNIRATCLFTLAPTQEQLALLADLAPYYEYHILLDRAAYHNALGLQSKLSVFHPVVDILPAGYDDPGELDLDGVQKLIGDRSCKETHLDIDQNLRGQ